jgi:hypothetical protein
MKLYLENDAIVWEKLKKKKSIPWHNHLKKEETMMEFYSTEGMYQMKMTTGKIFKLNQIDFLNVERKVDCVIGYVVLQDKNSWKYEETCHIPFDHMCMEITKYTFSLFELKQKRVKCILVFLKKRENPKELVDFYFEVPIDMDDGIINEEITEFLSSLN